MPSAKHALLAAFECQHVLAQYNAALDQEHQDFIVPLSGFGIDAGPDVWVCLEDGKPFGDVVKRAFHLGEDLAEDSQPFVTDNVRELCLRAQQSGENWAKSLAFKRHEIDEPDAVWIVTRDESHDPALAAQHFAEIVLHTASTRVHDGCDQIPEEVRQEVRLLLSRARVNGDALSELDTTLRTSCLRTMTTCMIGWTWQGSAVHGMLLRHRLAELINAHLALIDHVHYNPELGLVFFEHPLPAVVLAISLRAALRRMGVAALDPAVSGVQLKGIACHTGEVLWIDETNVHWGSPVNFASKLAEDLAQQGEVWITDETYQLVRDSSAFQALRLTATPRQLATDKDQFSCVQLDD
jgi:class 3 adenylate cyclase